MFFYFFIAFSLLALVVYTMVFLYYAKWFTNQNTFWVNETLKPKTFFSIIIPARNEEQFINDCLESVLNQNYPNHLFEIIVADDYSEDKTAEIVENLSIKNPSLQLIKMQDVLGKQQINSYKKKAIETAVQQAKGNWIVCTDADCLVTENWLACIDNYIQQNHVFFVAAPVQFFANESWLNLFQRIDFATLQAVTASTSNNGFHTLCNGANMAYSKQAYLEVDGFKGVDDVASGDDLLLLQKIKTKFGNTCGYLLHENAIVKTYAMKTLKTFFNQRIRWASKTKRYTDKNMLFVLSFALVLNVSILTSFALLWFSKWFGLYCIAVILLKATAEWQLIKKAKNYFIQTNFFTFLVLQPLHIIYVFVAAWFSFFGKYTWKERRVK